MGVACFSSLLSNWSAEAYGNRFVAKTSVGCLWVSSTSRDVLCLTSTPCNTQQLSSPIKKRTVDIMMLVLLILGGRRPRGSQLGPEKRRHENLPFPTAGLRGWVFLYFRPLEWTKWAWKLVEELNNGIWFIILLMFSVGKLEIAMVLARPQWIRVKDLIWVCWSLFGHFILACWKKKVRKQQSYQCVRLGRPTKTWDTYFTQKGQKDVSLTYQHSLCGSVDQYCRFRIQSLNQSKTSLLRICW